MSDETRTAPIDDVSPEERALRQAAMAELRDMARENRSVCAMIDFIKAHFAADCSTFTVVSLLLEAFALPFTDLRDLQGAQCLGGGVYDDHEVEETFGPIVRRACHRLTYDPRA